MKNFIGFFLILCNQLAGQVYTEHTTNVSNNSLIIYQYAYFYSDLADYYYIDSMSVDGVKSGNLTIDLVYDVPPMSHVLGFSWRVDTLQIDSLSSGIHRLIVNSYNQYDSAFDPGTGQFFDTLWPKDSDTSYFQILSQAAYPLQSSFQHYPNPAHGIVEISGLEDKPEVTIQIMDQAGQLVRRQVINHRNPEITVAGLSPGIYLLNMKWQDKEVTRKLIIE